MATNRIGWLIVLTAPLLAACGEEPVVSKYTKVPRPFDVSITLPEANFPSAGALNVVPVSLPSGKYFELKGRVRGVAPLRRKAMGSVRLRPVGVANAERASAFLKIEFLDEDTLQYSAAIERLSRPEEIEIFVHLMQNDPIIIPARVE
jgi:hypothetical protein